MGESIMVRKGGVIGGRSFLLRFGTWLQGFDGAVGVTRTCGTGEGEDEGKGAASRKTRTYGIRSIMQSVRSLRINLLRSKP
jgi:hypothetical protein